MKPAPNPKDLATEALNAVRSGDRALGFIASCHAAAHPQAGQREHLIFGEALVGMKMSKFEPVIRDALLSYLKNDRVDHRKALPLWITLMQADPDMAAVMDCVLRGGFGATDWQNIEKALREPIVTEALRRFIISNIEFENFFRAVRRVLLLDLFPKGALKTKDLPFICALAENCFLNEYVFGVTNEETAALAALPLADAVAVSIAGCYAPLTARGVNPKLSGVSAFRQMVAAQVREPAREMELLETIPSFGAIEDEVSRNVRAMYEENPYPRWNTINLPLTNENIEGGKMLIAGCGTGRTSVQMGVLFPDMHITAIDITRRSIAYAMRMCEHYGAEHVTFRHGDIMNLDAVEEKFDFIECSGVLHHMADPVAGWKKLIGRLAPGGIMLICLYSSKARRNVKKTRAYIEEKGYKPVPADIRTLRAEIMEDRNHPLAGLATSRDFFTLSEMRDLVFHVQETTYTLPELKKIMDDLGLEFLRMRVADKRIAALYAQKFPDDPSMCSFENWDRFEDEYPDAFMSMYKIICKKRGEDAANPAAQTILRRVYKD